MKTYLKNEKAKSILHLNLTKDVTITDIENMMTKFFLQVSSPIEAVKVTNATVTDEWLLQKDGEKFEASIPFGINLSINLPEYSLQDICENLKVAVGTELEGVKILSAKVKKPWVA
jgi:hypothetical protein